MIDGKWYNFTNDGKMNQNTMTQEGYPVDANGALMDPTGMISQILSTQYNK